MEGILGICLIALIGWVLFAVGGWWLLVGGLAVLIWLVSRAPAKKTTPAAPMTQAENKTTATKQEPPKTVKRENPKLPFVPTSEQLAQIEQARKSSLASLKAKEQGIKLPVKVAITPPSTSPVAVPRKQAAKPTVQDIEPIDLPDRVEINYLKSDGGLDRRIVNVNQVDRFGDKFTGFCERAGAVRTFKASGIQGEVTRLETGEMVDHRAWFNALKGNSTPSPKPAQRERKSAVALLGFHYSKYEALAEQVEAAGWHARHALSDSVDYVVFGPNAGDRQRKDADKRVITELSESQLKKML